MATSSTSSRRRSRAFCMAEKTTIARPYAKAAFQEAQADKDSVALVREAARRAPRRCAIRGCTSCSAARASSGEDLAQFVMDVTGAALDEHGQNFFRMLGGKPSLGVSAGNFRAVRRVQGRGGKGRRRRRSPPRRRSTAASSRRSPRRWSASSSARYALHFATDSTLIGGAVLRAGDTVIDGSLLSRLKRIAFELTA